MRELTMSRPRNCTALPYPLVRVAMLAALLCAVAPAIHAEYVVLRSGSRLHITGYERIGDTLRLHISGGTVDLAADEVVRIEPEEIFAAVVPDAKPEPPLLVVPYAELIRAAALRYRLDPQLVAGVVAVESNFNPRAISVKNAQGLMQLLPGTSTWLAVRNPFDPAENIEAGARYLRELLDRFGGNVTLALAAYNAGPDRVTQYGGVPPYRETLDYVRRITKGLNPPDKSPSAPLNLAGSQGSAAKTQR